MPEPEIYTKITNFISQGKFKQALKVITPILQSEPENVGLLLDAGFIYANLDKIKEAIETYKKVIELVPSNPAGFTGLGFVYKIQGNNKKRLEMFQKAVKLSPANAMVHFEVGEVLLEMEHYENALKSYNKAIQFGGIETEAETLIRIAQTQLGLNNPDKTIEISNNVIKNFPDYKTIHYVLAGAEAMKENYKEAIVQIEKYLEADPEDKDAQEMLQHLKDELK
jgi:tetratricopeptide (TPR) repeat protein